MLSVLVLMALAVLGQEQTVHAEEILDCPNCLIMLPLAEFYDYPVTSLPNEKEVGEDRVPPKKCPNAFEIMPLSEFYDYPVTNVPNEEETGEDSVPPKKCPNGYIMVPLDEFYDYPVT